MIKRITRRFFWPAIMVVLCLRVVLWAADSTKVIDFEDAPDAAQKAMKKNAGKAKIVEVSKVVENGQTFYDAKFGTEAKFKTMRLAADGKLVFKQVYINETPPNVRKEISKQAAGGKLKRIVRSYEDPQGFEVKFTKGGKDREFTVGVDGKLASRQMTLRETPAEVQKTIRKEMGHGEIVQILKTVEDGEIYFQVDFVKEKEDEQRTMNVAADGTLTSMQVFATELPVKVQTGIRAELRGGKVGEIYKTFDEEGMSYDVEIVRREKTYALTLDADGKLIDVEMEITDTPAAVQKTFKEQLGDTEVEKVTKVNDEGTIIYAVEFTKNEKAQTLTVAADGKLLDQEMEIGLSDAPTAVQKTIKEQAGQAEIVGIVRIIADGETVYAVEAADEKRSFTLTIGESGKLVSVEEELPLDQVPPAVRKTITEQLGGGKLESITKSIEDKKVFYDVEATKDGKSLSFSVDPDGKNLGKRD